MAPAGRHAGCPERGVDAAKAIGDAEAATGPEDAGADQPERDDVAAADPEDAGRASGAAESEGARRAGEPEGATR